MSHPPAALPPFDPTIRSAPQRLPQPGLEGVSLVYALDRVRELSYHTPPAVAAQAAAEIQLQSQRGAIDALPDGPEKREALQTWEVAKSAAYRAMCLALIDHYVLEVAPWPYAGAAPNPHVATSWGQWPTLLLDYITSGEALTRAREGLDGFLSPMPVSPQANSETVQP